MITCSLLSSLLVFSVPSDTSALDSLQKDYGSVRGLLEDYNTMLLDRVDPSPLLPATNLALSTGMLAGVFAEERSPSTTVVLSQSASALASATQLGLGLWMPASDLKLGALKFSEFYAWGFQAVGQFFYGRQLIEAGLNHPDALIARRLEERGELHQSLSWMTALWGFQSTFLRSWTRYEELQSELQRLDQTPETNEDYIRAKREHALKLQSRFRQLIIDDLELRGTIEVALASAATALVALKAPKNKQVGYYAITGLGLSAGIYKLVSAWTMDELSVGLPAQVQMLPVPHGVMLALSGSL
jgi:hypothetical protein